MEAQLKFMTESVMGFNPINKGFFKMFENEQKCSKCKHEFFALHVAQSKKLWCMNCYINSYCLIEYYDDNTIIRQKISKKILFSDTFDISQRISNISIYNLIQTM